MNQTCILSAETHRVDVIASLLLILFQEDSNIWSPERQFTLHQQRQQDFACPALDAKLGFLVVSLLPKPYGWDAKQRFRWRRGPVGCHHLHGAVLPQECGPDAPRPSSTWLPVCPLCERGSGLGPDSVLAASSLCPWGRRNVMDRSSSPRMLQSCGLFSSCVSCESQMNPCKSRACPELGDPQPVSEPPQPRFPHLESMLADDPLAGRCKY